MNMTYQPLISVVVPVYGVEPYIDKCIESIIGQTYEKLEIILVDDGSKDNCPKIVDEWAGRDNRIKAVHKPNGGVSSARNAGLDIMTGEYVTFIDSDDWVQEDYIEMLYMAIQRYSAQVAVGAFFRNYDDHETKSQFFIPSAPMFYSCSSEQASRYFFEQAIAVWGKLYEMETIRNIRFINGRLAEDLPYQVEVLTHTKVVAFCNKHLYHYRIRTDSIARTIKPKYLIDHIISLQEAHQRCRLSIYMEEIYCKSWLSSLLYEFYAAEKFGTEEKVQNRDILEEALRSVGGREKLIENISEDLNVIFYTYSQFGIWMTTDEKRKIQRDYRKCFSIRKINNYHMRFLLKYLLAYMSLEVTQTVAKKWRKAV